jgi:hypothetical protein
LTAEPVLAGFDGTGGAGLIEMVVGNKRQVFVFEGKN